VPSNKKIAVKPYDDSPLGERTPLILVHDNNNESDHNGYYGWYKYINRMKNSAELSNKYKVYTYRWNSNWSNLNNGVAMGVLIDSLSDLVGKDILILAHGRGGLVSRYYMNEYRRPRSGNYIGRQAGEKIKRLVTLATPHRGTPLADRHCDTFSFDYNHIDAVAYELCKIRDFLFSNTYKNLLWDDWDKELTNRKVCWDSGCEGNNYCARFSSDETRILNLNQNEDFYERILAIGGNRFDGKPFEPLLLAEVFLGSFSWNSLPLNLRHNGLIQLSRIMAEMPIIPDKYTKAKPHIDDSYRPFKANDGMVPLISSLFLRFGSGRVFDVDTSGNLTYDEAKVKELCLAGSYVIVQGSVDHFDFLYNSDVIKEVLKILKGL
jgi:hypothetical protein